MHGVLLLDKPVGLSSNDALQKAKRLYRAEKAGHTGTLDPLEFVAGELRPRDGTIERTWLRDLDGDGTREIIAYASAPAFCGPDGCAPSILRREGADWQDIIAVMSEETSDIDQYPLRVAFSETVSRYAGLLSGLSVGGTFMYIYRLLK